MCTPLPDSFIVLHTQGYCESAMSEQKPLAHAFSPAVLQSSWVCSLLTSVTFDPPMPSKLHEKLTSSLLQTIEQVSWNSVPQSSGAAWKSRWPCWAPVPNKPTVSVDVKQHSTHSAPPPPPPPPYPPPLLTFLLCARVCVCVCVCVQGIRYHDYIIIIFKVIMYTFSVCWSCGVRCTLPCRWDMAL